MAGADKWHGISAGVPQQPIVSNAHAELDGVDHTASAGQQRRPARFERAFVCVNGRASNHFPEAAEQIRAKLAPGCGHIDVVVRRKGQSRRRLVRAAVREGCDLVVAAGGDGTVSRVADGLVGRPGVLLGIVPLGTGNVVARDLGIPLELDRALDVVLDPGSPTRVLDGMRVGRRVFFSHVSVGAYADAITKLKADERTTPEADRQRRSRRGAHIVAVVHEIARKRRWRLRLDVDGRSSTVRASTVLVANVAPVGVAGVTWSSATRSDDGRLEVCVMSGRGIVTHLLVAGAALLGRTERAPTYQVLEARREVAVQGPASLPVRADGARHGTGGFVLTPVPAAVEVLVPLADATRRRDPGSLE